MKAMIDTALAHVILGLSLIVLGIPLACRLIPKNFWYGFRVGKTLATDENWFMANAYAGKWMVAWAIPIIISGIVLYCMVPDTRDKALIVSVLSWSWLLIFGLAIQCFLFLKKLP